MSIRPQNCLDLSIKLESKMWNNYFFKLYNKDYTVRFKVANSDYGNITVPKGTPVTNQTACGIDENYHFVNDFSWVKPHKSGTPQYGLLHDLRYYGMNVPKEFVNQ